LNTQELDELDGTADPVEVTSAEEGAAFVEEFGFPVRLYSAFSLRWQALASTPEEFSTLFEEAMRLSPIDVVGLARA
jgi:hypothetical protein